MPDWKLDKAQKLARIWPDDALGKAFVAVAEADEGVKGGAADAGLRPRAVPSSRSWKRAKGR